MYRIKFKKYNGDIDQIYKEDCNSLEEAQIVKSSLEVDGFWFCSISNLIVSPPYEVTIEEY